VSRHAEIADAVVAAINAVSAGQFTAVRKARPKVNREKLDAAIVQVVPSTFACEGADRGRKRAHYGIDVGIQKAIDPDNLTAFDGMHDWLATIRAVFELQRLPGLTVAVWERTETVAEGEAGYVTDHLDSLGIYTGILRFTFGVIE